MCRVERKWRWLHDWTKWDEPRVVGRAQYIWERPKDGRDIQGQCRYCLRCGKFEVRVLRA